MFPPKMCQDTKCTRFNILVKINTIFQTGSFFWFTKAPTPYKFQTIFKWENSRTTEVQVPWRLWNLMSVPAKYSSIRCPGIFAHHSVNTFSTFSLHSTVRYLWIFIFSILACEIIFAKFNGSHFMKWKLIFPSWFFLF